MDKPPKKNKRDVFLTYKIWLSGVTGDGKISDSTFALLHQIKELGSIKTAATEVGMSYRKAWGDIEQAEAILGYQLIEKHRGGKDGGNSSLTAGGQKLLEAYHALQQRFDDSVEEAFAEFKKSVSNQHE